MSNGTPNPRRLMYQLGTALQIPYDVRNSFEEPIPNVDTHPKMPGALYVATIEDYHLLARKTTVEPIQPESSAFLVATLFRSMPRAGPSSLYVTLMYIFIVTV